ncbi:DUF943 domain-containing protein [Rahnella bruchi]|uniref:DUF943 family protein n=1 Tax=Rahnella bruchi TaxID=1510573 RepID=UPI000EA0FF63|nr:DUF943 family protein [Rahnella bruchi]
MRVKVILLIIGVLIFQIYLFLSLRKAEIILVHQGEEFTDIVVRNFPITNIGRAKWWQENQLHIKEKYNALKVDEFGNYHVFIFDIGKGFKKNSEADSIWFSFSTTDLICFDEIKSEDRCIEKNILMRVTRKKTGETNYMFDGD